MKPSKIKKPEINTEAKPIINKIRIKNSARIIFWFSIGAFLTLFLVTSFSYFAFQAYYKDKTYPGISINGEDFSQKTETEIKNYFTEKNNEFSNSQFVFSFENNTSTVSAKEIDFGYDENLLATQAMSIGRTKDPLSGMSMIIQAYLNGVNLPPAYKFSPEKLDEKLETIYIKVNKKPIEAVFNFEDGRVNEFKASENGLEVNKEELNKKILEQGKLNLNKNIQKMILIPIPTKIIKPNLTTDKVNQMGIKELIGIGTSSFKGSIENRIFNINLAANRLNGTLIKPDEIFSFNKTIGDVSSLTGYKQAFVIQNGRTVLGDGGGVCQVSTTFFRALLNGGLPIVERNPHAYRVSYYEQDSAPGIDAAIYTPNVDLKFKNDTDKHILVQTVIDNTEQKLTFMLYGTSDGRISEISTPIIHNQSPAPEPKFEDDPNLPAGQTKQVDFAAAGAKVSFTRTVKKNGKEIINETFSSNYRPWQAVFLRGTKTQ